MPFFFCCGSVLPKLISNSVKKITALTSPSCSVLRSCRDLTVARTLAWQADVMGRGWHCAPAELGWRPACHFSEPLFAFLVQCGDSTASLFTKGLLQRWMKILNGRGFC
jgi:hypothetical protein